MHKSFGRFLCKSANTGVKNKISPQKEEIPQTAWLWDFVANVSEKDFFKSSHRFIIFIQLSDLYYFFSISHPKRKYKGLKLTLEQFAFNAAYISNGNPCSVCEHNLHLALVYPSDGASDFLIGTAVFSVIRLEVCYLYHRTIMSIFR